MKRIRPESSTPSTKLPQTISTKPQKRSKEATPRSTARAKARKAEGEENSAVVPAMETPAPVAVQEGSQVEWDDGGSWPLGWWVDEELLLGWFPFEDGDFLCSDSRTGWWDDYLDIWHLQHIHEIPSSANNLEEKRREEKRGMVFSYSVDE